MILLINTASTFKGGGGVQVAASFIEECRKYPENQYHVILGDVVDGLVSRNSFPDNFFFYRAPFRPATRLFTFKSHNRFFKKLEKEVKADCVFTTSGPAYWRPTAPHLVGYNLPHHVYADSPFFSRITSYVRLRWLIKKIVHLYFFKKDSDEIVTQTEDVSRRLAQLLPRKKIHTVSNTFSHVFDGSGKSTADKLPRRENGEIRLLSLTAYHAHKNLGILKDVVPILKERGAKNIQFVLTIDHGQYDKIFPIESRSVIKNIGPVPIHECPSLYREVDAVILPTLLECFSANYPEAMVMQKPILTSDLGFARSVCGNAAIYFDPLDPNDIANKIFFLLQNPEEQKRLVSNGRQQLKNFPSAAERALAYLALCRKLVLKRSNNNLG